MLILLLLYFTIRHQSKRRTRQLTWHTLGYVGYQGLPNLSDAVIVTIRRFFSLRGYEIDRVEHRRK